MVPLPTPRCVCTTRLRTAGTSCCRSDRPGRAGANVPQANAEPLFTLLCPPHPPETTLQLAQTLGETSFPWHALLIVAALSLFSVVRSAPVLPCSSTFPHVVNPVDLPISSRAWHGKEVSPRVLSQLEGCRGRMLGGCRCCRGRGRGRQCPTATDHKCLTTVVRAWP